jgi:hypothetical protein
MLSETVSWMNSVSRYLRVQPVHEQNLFFALFIPMQVL